jgi:hypothetical protein
VHAQGVIVRALLSRYSGIEAALLHVRLSYGEAFLQESYVSVPECLLCYQLTEMLPQHGWIFSCTSHFQADNARITFRYLSQVTLCDTTPAPPPAGYGGRSATAGEWETDLGARYTALDEKLKMCEVSRQRDLNV